MPYFKLILTLVGIIFVNILCLAYARYKDIDKSKSYVKMSIQHAMKESFLKYINRDFRMYLGEVLE